MSNGPRVEMRRYLRRWLEWAKALNDDDLRTLIGFLQAVKHAHYQGQQAKPLEVEVVNLAKLDEGVHQGEPTMEKSDDTTH